MNRLLVGSISVLLLSGCGQAADREVPDLAKNGRPPIERRPNEKHLAFFDAVAFVADGKYALAGNTLEDGLVLWDVESGEKGPPFAYQDGPKPRLANCADKPRGTRAVAVSPDGKWALDGRNAGHIFVLNISTGKVVRVLEGHTQYVTSVAFSPDGRQIVSGSDDDSIKLWEADTGKEVATVTGHIGRVNVVAFAPDGRSVLSAGLDGAVFLWDARSRRSIRQMVASTSSPILAAAFSQTGQYVVAGDEDGVVRLWEVATGNEVLAYRGHRSKVTALVCCPNGRHVLTAEGREGCLHLWDLSTGKKVRQLDCGGYPVGIAISADGSRVIIGGVREVSVWDMKGFKRLRKLPVW
jgi:WD40 repeat protein